MDLDKIEKLNELKEKGLITQQEYDQAKARALGVQAASPPLGDIDNRGYSMLLHFSQLSGIVVPVFGWLIPLILWLIKREDPYINEQGKVVFNWIVSSFIYFILCLVLTLVLVGFFMMVALGITSIILIVLGAIKAKEGKVQNYPLSIGFFAVDQSVAAE
jgi:uncharacterized Tic20 family protein